MPLAIARGNRTALGADPIRIGFGMSLTGPLAPGGKQCLLAMEIWRDCTQAGVWPGYSQDIELITLPPWAARTEGDYLT